MRPGARGHEAAVSGGRFAASTSTLSSLAQETEGYEMTKSSVHFDSAAPLPVVLVRKSCQGAISRRLVAAVTSARCYVTVGI